MKNNQHKYQRRARTPVLFQCDKHFIVLYLKCNDLCNYSNITLYCKGLECHTLKSVVKTIGGRKKKKGPPLTLHTPGSTAFVLGRIMFDSVDKGKHPFFKSIKEKSFFLNIKSRRGGCSPPQQFPTPKLQDQTQAYSCSLTQQATIQGKGRCNSTSKNKNICQQGFLKSQRIYLLTESINQALNLG